MLDFIPKSLDNTQATEPRPVSDLSGPVLGPSHDEGQRPNTPLARDSSPFSTSRTLIQDLTLPPVPNLDIPPSPPGSPDPIANAKFAHFLSLKKQSVHFNEKLASSASLRNPSLLQKLMNHSGIVDEAQYANSLSLGIWDIASFPVWGYKEELLKAQKEVQHKAENQRQAGKREAIDFVTATLEDTETGSMPSSWSRPK